MIETVTVCGSCVTGEHMCGGGCACWCTKPTDEDWDEMNWRTLQYEIEEEERER